MSEPEQQVNIHLAEVARAAGRTSVMLRPMAARHLTPGTRVLSYRYIPEDDALVPVIVTVTLVRRMLGIGPVLGYSYVFPGGRGEVSGGVDAVIVVEASTPAAPLSGGGGEQGC